MSTNVVTVTNELPPRACKRPAGPLTRRQCREAHRIEMQLRRAAQLTRVRGFTPVINEHLSRRVQGAFAELMVEHADKLSNGTITVRELQDRAVSRIAATLPPERMVFDWRKGLPSKNNDAAYRKA